MDLKGKLKAFCDKNGIIYGIGTAQPFIEYEAALSRSVPFVKYSPRERIYPSLTMEGVKSLIAIGLSYNVSYAKPQDNGLRCMLSEGAVGEDYHLKMKAVLDELCSTLFTNGEQYLSFCDTGPLSDAVVALRCGLGFQGLNHSVINDRFGSMFFIGYIMTDVELEPTTKPQNKCTACGLCVKKCPSGAISADGSFNAERCVAYLTQKKGVIEDELKELMGTYIYGCDICRSVCPLNPPRSGGEGCAYPLIGELLTLSNKDFAKLYGSTAIGWRGKRTIVRNAIIALGNLKDKRGLELLSPFLESELEDLKDAACWAKNKINGV